MRLFFLVLLMAIVGAVLGGPPADKTKQWPAVSLQDDFRTNVLDAPNTDQDVLAGGVALAVFIIGGLALGQRDREFGYKFESGIMIVVIIVLICAIYLLLGGQP